MAEAFLEDHSPSKASTPARVSRSKERIRDLALYHANLLQQRKDAEAEILKSTEMLLDFPTSSTSVTARPSNADIQAVKMALRLFQPSDYDALIEERNINRTCGYVFCSRPNKLQSTSARSVMLRGRGKTDKWKYVDKKLLERWCSDDCAKKALYIKVQLNEEPAWERAAGASGEIMLLDEKDDPLSHVDPVAQLSTRLNDISVTDGEEPMIAAMRQLALERGDSDHRKAHKTSPSFREGDVREYYPSGGSKELSGRIGQEPTGPHDAIEGYIPRGTNRRTRQRTSTSRDGFDDEDNALSELVYGTYE